MHVPESVHGNPAGLGPALEGGEEEEEEEEAEKEEEQDENLLRIAGPPAREREEGQRLGMTLRGLSHESGKNLLQFGKGPSPVTRTTVHAVEREHGNRSQNRGCCPRLRRREEHCRKNC